MGSHTPLYTPSTTYLQVVEVPVVKHPPVVEVAGAPPPQSFPKQVCVGGAAAGEEGWLVKGPGVRGATTTASGQHRQLLLLV